MTNEQRLHNVYIALAGTARHWFKNHLVDRLNGVLKLTFTSQHPREWALDLRMRTQGAHDAITSFVEGVLRLIACADPQGTKK